MVLLIHFTKGNIVKAETEAIINTVNTVGVMGKGIALQFKSAFPGNAKEYEIEAKNGKIRLGKMFVYETGELLNPKYLINFPTKNHWRYPSKMEYITEGLKDLRKVIIDKGIKSISIPPLGCGNGGLKWTEVKLKIVEALKDLEIEITIFEPSDIAYREAPIRKNIKLPKLTVVRAMVILLIEQYQILGYEATLLEVQKLVYLLQRIGIDLKLSFTENHYGPYAEKLIHVLYDLDGYYISGTKAKDAKPFDVIHIIKDKIDEVHKYWAENASTDEKDKLKLAFNLIEGFESPLGMELLATVDFVIKRNKKLLDQEDRIIQKVHSWSSRKAEIMNNKSINVAKDRLSDYKEILYS